MTNLSTLYSKLHDVVVADIKGMKLENHEIDDLYDNPDIWYDTLVELKREVELQLVDKRRELHQKSIEFSGSVEKFEAYQDEYNVWRVKVLRFLASIESKLRFVKRVRKEAYDNESE